MPPGDKKLTTLKAEQLDPAWTLADDFPCRVIRVVSEPGVDFANAAKILLPDQVDSTSDYYRISRELREGRRPAEFLKLDEKWETVSSADAKKLDPEA